MENLATQFRGYASIQPQEGLRYLYEDIADALADEVFVSILSGLGYDNILKEMERSLATSMDQYYLDNIGDVLKDIHALYSIRKLENKIGVNSLRRHVDEIQEQIDAAKVDIANISEKSGILTGAEMLETYAKDFDREAKEHDSSARHWLGWFIVLILGLIVLIVALLFVPLYDLALIREISNSDSNEGIEISRFVALAIKGGILTAYTQILLFVRKNYYAERHLEQANIHRRNVLRSLRAVYNTVGSGEERDRLLVIGATTAFSEPESGFITRKEGAGSENSSIDAIIKALGK